MRDISAGMGDFSLSRMDTTSVPRFPSDSHDDLPNSVSDSNSMAEVELCAEKTRSTLF